VKDLVSGSKSGLTRQTRESLETLNSLFDLEVHGAALGLALEEKGRRGHSWRLPMGPQLDPSSYLLYINRSCEQAWLMLRLLPFLQEGPASFGENWRDKWSVLDHWLRSCFEDLNSGGGPHIKAIIELVEAKFAFDPSCCYRETMG